MLSPPIPALCHNALIYMRFLSPLVALCLASQRSTLGIDWLPPRDASALLMLSLATWRWPTAAAEHAGHGVRDEAADTELCSQRLHHRVCSAHGRVESHLLRQNEVRLQWAPSVPHLACL